MTMKHFFSAMLFGAALAAAPAVSTTPAFALGAELEAYLGAEPALFDTPEAAITAFKDALAANDVKALATLLGLDAAKLAAFEGITGKIDELRAAAARRVAAESEDDAQQTLVIGSELWPFPFPLVKDKDGKWAFDTVAGMEEIVNRRIGANELQAIDTARLYVEAQAAYAAEDRDADGVLEFAGRLVSSEGQTDGLYWPIEQGDGESPAGAGIDAAALEKAKGGEGYFGYKFRILTKQGANVAGGAYDYVINGNMIAGFGLIATPARYGETGVSTFIISHAGIVYEKDLGEDTETAAAAIDTFNPDSSWSVVED